MEGLLNTSNNHCCMTPFHKNINLTSFLVRDKFVWRGRVLLLANSHKFWYPTLGAIQDLVLQAGATKNPLHQFQTWSHFASQKYQTQVFSKISKSNIPKNIKLKDSQKYQTPKFSEIIKHLFRQKFACSNLLKLSQILWNILEFNYSQKFSASNSAQLCCHILQMVMGYVKRPLVYLSVHKSPRGPLAQPPSPHLLYIIQRHVTNFITRAGSWKPKKKYQAQCVLMSQWMKLGELIWN